MQVRAPIAEFFAVPPYKIGPSCNLAKDLELDHLAPSFQSFVVGRVAQLRGQPPKPVDGPHVIALPPTAAAVTVADFTRELLRMFQ